MNRGQREWLQELNEAATAALEAIIRKSPIEGLPANQDLGAIVNMVSEKFAPFVIEYSAASEHLVELHNDYGQVTAEDAGDLFYDATLLTIANIAYRVLKGSVGIIGRINARLDARFNAGGPTVFEHLKGSPKTN